MQAKCLFPNSFDGCYRPLEWKCMLGRLHPLLTSDFFIILDSTRSFSLYNSASEDGKLEAFPFGRIISCYVSVQFW